MIDAELLANLDRLHTTPLGTERVRRNLSAQIGDVAAWCRACLAEPDAESSRRGKNWYAAAKGVLWTINARSHTIITAHPIPGK
ncbi:MAG: DUF3781 domain-containing protein [Schwartzia sp.]|nr:DUF3781 domain-containing protein [Schwartzia sp. (in: firmicutes)]